MLDGHGVHAFGVKNRKVLSCNSEFTPSVIIRQLCHICVKVNIFNELLFVYTINGIGAFLYLATFSCRNLFGLKS